MRAFAVATLALLVLALAPLFGASASDAVPASAPTAGTVTILDEHDQNETTQARPDVVANFTLETCGEERGHGQTCSFDASFSDARMGKIQEYRWRFEAGQWRNTTGPKVSYHFSEPGTHNVSLMVLDQEGNRETVTQTFEIQADEEAKASAAWYALGVGAVAFAGSIALARLT